MVKTNELTASDYAKTLNLNYPISKEVDDEGVEYLKIINPFSKKVSTVFTIDLSVKNMPLKIQYQNGMLNLNLDSVVYKLNGETTVSEKSLIASYILPTPKDIIINNEVFSKEVLVKGVLFDSGLLIPNVFESSNHLARSDSFSITPVWMKAVLNPGVNKIYAVENQLYYNNALQNKETLKGVYNSFQKKCENVTASSDYSENCWEVSFSVPTLVNSFISVRVTKDFSLKEQSFDKQKSLENIESFYQDTYLYAFGNPADPSTFSSVNLSESVVNKPEVRIVNVDSKNNLTIGIVYGVRKEVAINEVNVIQKYELDSKGLSFKMLNLCNSGDNCGLVFKQPIFAWENKENQIKECGQNSMQGLAGLFLHFYQNNFLSKCYSEKMYK